MELVRLDGGPSATLALCGGKGFALNALIRAGFPVPPAFCVTTLAFEQALSAHRLEVFSQSDALPDYVRGILQREALPTQLRVAVGGALIELLHDVPAASAAVSARSSAPAEDGELASFAGQFESFLNLRDLDDLDLAIRRCWASAFAERAIAYRQQHAVDFIPMAVVVQQLARTDVFAVAFTRNPLLPDADELLINASYGLGEPIVAGEVNPDSYRVARAGGLTQVTLGGKDVMAVCSQYGGIELLPTPRLLRQAPCLSESQLDELRRLALDVEHWLGAPADIECGLCNGQWRLLQCRPITTLRAVAPGAAREEERV